MSKAFPMTFNKTVTVCHKIHKNSGDVWQIFTVNNCSWVCETTRSVSESGAIAVGQSVTCRIPEKIDIRQGDYVFLGSVHPASNTASIIKAYQENKPNAAQIKAVRDNTSLPLSPHIKVIGI